MSKSKLKGGLRALLLFCKEDVKITGVGKCHFTKSEWEDFSAPDRVSVRYMLWRWAYMAYCIFAVVYSLHYSITNGKKYPYLYLTNWSVLIQMIYSILFVTYHCIICMSQFKNSDKDIYHEDPGQDHGKSPNGNKIKMENLNGADAIALVSLSSPVPAPAPAKGKLTRDNDTTNDNTSSLGLECLESAIWFLFNIVSTAEVFVTVIYWGLLIFYTGADCKEIKFKYFLNHGINALLAVTDLMVVALPARVSHFVFPAGFVSLYLSFSFLYEIGGGNYPKPNKPYVYSVLNWRDNPLSAVGYSFVGLFFVGFLHVFITCLSYSCRLHSVSKWSCRRDKERVYEYHNFYGISTTTEPEPTTTTTTSTADTDTDTVTAD